MTTRGLNEGYLSEKTHPSGFVLFLIITLQNAPTYRKPHISPQDRVYLTAGRYGCRRYEIWVSWEKDMGIYSFTTLSE